MFSIINIENEVFTQIATTLRSEFEGIYILGEDGTTTSKFPCVTIEEFDNYPYQHTEDTKSCENHAIVVYEVNVYSNKANGKKAECKNILSVIDDEFLRLGFTRRIKNHITMNDSTVCRMLCRYEAVVSQNKTIYRR